MKEQQNVKKLFILVELPQRTKKKQTFRQHEIGLTIFTTRQTFIEIELILSYNQ